jgi:polysaccharide export outer membrane protein
VEIRVYGAPDLSQPNKVNDEGNISMPLLGYVHLEGLTSKEAEELIARRLREGEFLRDPQVTVLVKQYMSDGVTVLGEVNRPGIYPVPNSGRLLDLILAAGGFTPKAGYTAVVKRRERGDSPLTIQLTGDQPMDDIQVMPGDIISIPKGKIVYVLGAVNQPGGYVIPDESLSVLEAVARANGPSANASLGKTQLLHRREGVITQVPIPLPSVMKGKTPDPKLQADDILYIPPKSEKSAYRTVMSLASLAGTVAIFRPY